MALTGAQRTSLKSKDSLGLENFDNGCQGLWIEGRFRGGNIVFPLSSSSQDRPLSFEKAQQPSRMWI